MTSKYAPLEFYVVCLLTNIQISISVTLMSRLMLELHRSAANNPMERNISTWSSRFELTTSLMLSGHTSSDVEHDFQRSGVGSTNCPNSALWLHSPLIYWYTIWEYGYWLTISVSQTLSVYRFLTGYFEWGTRSGTSNTALMRESLAFSTHISYWAILIFSGAIRYGFEPCHWSKSMWAP